MCDSSSPGGMRAHAVERGTDGRADAIQLVTDGAGGGEEGLAACDIARAAHLGQQGGDGLVLLGEGGAAESVDNLGGAPGDGGVRMRAQAVQRNGVEGGGVDLAAGEGFEQREAPGGSAEQDVEGGGAGGGIERGIDAGKLRAEAGIVAFAEASHDADL
jgi:hypothetical protein